MVDDPWAFGWDQLIGIGNVLAVVGAAFVGAFGVRNWRKERIDARHVALAEDALALMYRAQEVFDFVRSPGSFSNEGTTRVPQNEDETPEEKRQRDYNFIPLERLNFEQDYFEAVVKIRPRVKAVFGHENAGPLDVILDCRNKIVVAARMLSYIRLPEHFRTQEQLDRHLERQERNECVIWKGYSDAVEGVDEDPIDAPLQQAKDELSKLLTPIVRQRFAK